MRKNASVVRLVCVFTVCIALISYNIYSFCCKGRAAKITPLQAPTDGTAYIEKEEKTEEIKSEEAETSEQIEESTPASTDGSVKGKVISRYISPYNAGLSYNGVYLKNSTDLTVDIKELLESPLTFKISKDGSPQVLIVHTHTTETYMTEESDYYTEAFSSRTRQSDKNMVSVGKRVAEKLNGAGIKTLHDTTEHDYPNYTGSYSRAAKTINSYLKKYPSIKVVLDLHRDAVSSGESDKVKLVTEIDGKKAAQVMIISGCEGDGVEDFPTWKENLVFALNLQSQVEEKNAGLMRPVFFCNRKYNMDVTPCSLLLEFGTDANTLEEAVYSAQLIGDALARMLNNEMKG